MNSLSISKEKLVLGCFLGYTIANVIIENDIIELQNMNLTLAQLEHKKYVIATTDSVFMILGMVLFGVLLIAFGLCLQSIADYYKQIISKYLFISISSTKVVLT